MPLAPGLSGQTRPARLLARIRERRTRKGSKWCMQQETIRHKCTAKGFQPCRTEHHSVVVSLPVARIYALEERSATTLLA
jgi:hypothetical protein